MALDEQYGINSYLGGVEVFGENKSLLDNRIISAHAVAEVSSISLDYDVNDLKKHIQELYGYPVGLQLLLHYTFPDHVLKIEVLENSMFLVDLFFFDPVLTYLEYSRRLKLALRNDIRVNIHNTVEFQKIPNISIVPFEDEENVIATFSPADESLFFLRDLQLRIQDAFNISPEFQILKVRGEKLPSRELFPLFSEVALGENLKISLSVNPNANDELISYCKKQNIKVLETKMSVNIRHVQKSKVIEYYFQEDENVYNLREYIEKQYGIPFKSQLLIQHEKELWIQMSLSKLEDLSLDRDETSKEDYGVYLFNLSDIQISVINLSGHETTLNIFAEEVNTVLDLKEHLEMVLNIPRRLITLLFMKKELRDKDSLLPIFIPNLCASKLIQLNLFVKQSSKVIVDLNCNFFSNMTSLEMSEIDSILRLTEELQQVSGVCKENMLVTNSREEELDNDTRIWNVIQRFRHCKLKIKKVINIELFDGENSTTLRCPISDWNNDNVRKLKKDLKLRYGENSSKIKLNKIKTDEEVHSATLLRNIDHILYFDIFESRNYSCSVF